MMIYNYPSPVGNLKLVSNGKALVELSFLRDQSISNKDIDPIIQQTITYLDAYFSGEKPKNLIPLQLEGTPFQKEVWDILLSVPYGSLLTYGEIAKRIAKKRKIERMSSQAVGQAVGKNPICILVPCHRIIGANRQLTGFTGGMDIKIKLLELEGHLLDSFNSK